jgi:cell division protein FtsI/penicillin-binding protein 2
MWRNSKKTKLSRPEVNNNRLRLVVAIIFLFSGSLIYRLYYLQISECDTYTALAANQHEIYSKLKPDRGKIIITDQSGGESRQYVLATNKDFFLIFAVPTDIASSSEMAVHLYDFFDKDVTEKSAIAELKNQGQVTFEKRLQDINDNSSLTDEEKTARRTVEEKRQEEINSSSDYLELASIKLSQEIDRKRQEIIDAYQVKLSKPGSMYAVIENKVDDEKLLEFYAFINNLQNPATPVKADDLEVRVGQVINKQTSEEVKIKGFSFETRKFRYYPEDNIASHILGFVSYANEDGEGRYGLEEFFNEELFGKYGSLKGEKGGGNSMIVNDREYVKPVPGSDLVLTIDRSVEFFACDKLKQMVDKFKAVGGSVIIVEPKTGAIIAMCSVPDFNPNDYRNVPDIKIFSNPATSFQYEPGSVFKTVTMSIALDQGKVSPSTTYNDAGYVMINGWPKPIKNADFETRGGHGVVDMNSVLENSLNTGAIFAMKQVGPKIFSDYVKSYGFGERTGIELGAEATGNINNLLKKNVREIDAATASFGQGVSVTPLQMVMAYQALANKGVLMKPYIVKEIIHPDGRKEEIPARQIKRVVSEQTASKALAMLVNVVEKGHSKKEAIAGYYVGGKTGTAQIASAGGYYTDRYNHTFIGVAPADNPRFVMLTHIDSPKGIQYADGSAAPLWRDIADFLLKYYQVPKNRK